ncbi:F0F1 ATP synthase subunit B [bacterium]|nr:F0F1 ATP synthase subunit B [bacterium]MBU1637466.1 F0F1 ATP synthase subunit B [bacterium]MBU1919726.1 F0F1 ATP synthase subunit B [bacterium]RQV98433.1 MAG: ATP synthase F0 subunit B [bacterium]
MGLQNILNIEPGSIIWTIVSFLIVVWLVGKFGWKPLIQGLKSREDSIRHNLETAKAEREKAAGLLADYEQAIAGARKEATDIIQKAQDEANRQREQSERETKETTLKMIERARVDIERESDAAKTELSKHVAQLTARATSRLLGRAIDAKDHARLIDEALREDA